MSSDPKGTRLPVFVETEDDYQLILRRLAEITEGTGRVPQPGELGYLLERAEFWEMSRQRSRQEESQRAVGPIRRTRSQATARN